MCLFTVVEDSSWIMVAPLQGPEVDGAAGLAVAVRPDGLHLKKHEKSKQELFSWKHDVNSSYWSVQTHRSVSTAPSWHYRGMALCNDDKKLARQGIFSEQMVLWFLAAILNDRWRTNRTVSVDADWKLWGWKREYRFNFKTHSRAFLWDILCHQAKLKSIQRNDTILKVWCRFSFN